MKLEFSTDTTFTDRLSTVVELQVKALLEYFEEVNPALVNPRAVLSYRPDRVFYLELIFEELGRLATLLLLAQQISDQEELRNALRGGLIHLINQHPGARLPPYDGHAIDLTLVFTALMGEADWDNARYLLKVVVARLLQALKTDSYLPVDTDYLEDAVALHVTQKAGSRDFFDTSTLVPALATVAALLGDEESLAILRKRPAKSPSELQH